MPENHGSMLSSITDAKMMLVVAAMLLANVEAGLMGRSKIFVLIAACT